MSSVANSVLQATGNTTTYRNMLIGGLYRQIVAPIIVFYFLVNIFHLGINGVWWGVLGITWLAAIITVIYARITLNKLININNSQNSQ